MKPAVALLRNARTTESPPASKSAELLFRLAPRPAAVLVNNGEARLIRRRESYEDVLRCEVLEDVAGAGKGLGSLSARKGSL